MLSPDQVTAVIVTKGNVDLEPVLHSLIFDEVVVWDNAGEQRDQMTLGRHIAALMVGGVVYSQDDDIVHTAESQMKIVAAYESGVLTGCMWPEWSAGAKEQGIPDGYDDLVFPGSGAVYDATVPLEAITRYLRFFPLDDFLRLWADTIVGVIAPTTPLDIRFDALPCAEDPDRMCNLPDAVAQKAEAISRARYARDMTAPDAHAHYLAELAAGKVREHRYGAFA